jgi:hypothetical protein
MESLVLYASNSGPEYRHSRLALQRGAGRHFPEDGVVKGLLQFEPAVILSEAKDLMAIATGMLV